MLKYASDLSRAYPAFVNFFEDTKKTLEECDKNLPRFHAFLKVSKFLQNKAKKTGEILLSCLCV